MEHGSSFHDQTSMGEKFGKMLQAKPTLLGYPNTPKIHISFHIKLYEIGIFLAGKVPPCRIATRIFICQISLIIYGCFSSMDVELFSLPENKGNKQKFHLLFFLSLLSGLFGSGELERKGAKNTPERLFLDFFFLLK